MINPSEVDTHHYLILWDKIHWDAIIKLLNDAKYNCIRYDSNILINNNSKPNNKIQSKFNEQKLFNQHYDRLIFYCEISKALSPIRFNLEKQVDSDSDGQVNITDDEFNHVM